jgi:hypothetical protein
MKPVRAFLHLAGFCMVLTSFQEVQAQIVNGDFTGGLAGWTVKAFDRSSTTIDPSPFIHTTTVSGSPGVKFETGAYSDGLSHADMSQVITVTPATRFLRFDFTLPSFALDGTGTGASFGDDLFSVGIQPNGDVMSVDRDGNFGPSSPFLGVTITPSSTPGYDRTLTADLGNYIGAPYTVTLIFRVSQEDDGFLFDPFLDNVELAAVPEPAGVGLAFGIACAGLLLYRRARSRKG